MTKRPFAILSLLICTVSFLIVAYVLGLHLLGELLLSLMLAPTYILSIVVFHKWKMKAIKESFDPPHLWETMRRFWDSVEPLCKGESLDVDLGIDARKGCFFIHETGWRTTAEGPQVTPHEEIYRLEFIHYFTFRIPVYGVTEKLTDVFPSPDDRPYGFYEMAKRDGETPLFVIEIRTTPRLTQEQLMAIDAIIRSFGDRFVEIGLYAQQMNIVI